jgi:hypothetical protein
MTRTSFSAITLSLLFLVAGLGLPARVAAVPMPVPSRDAALRVDVWTDRGEGAVYNPGDDIAVYFHASDDCWLTIYDIDTEGRVRMLFPQYPDDGFIYGGMTYRIPDYYDRVTMRASGPRGVEYIHAVATREPRVFRRAIRERRYELDVDPIADDPFVAINTINARLLTPYYIHATATTSFFIEGRVWYPRYMCNSCHRSTRVRFFDPYRSVCPRYSVIVAHEYDYWWMYDYHPAATRFAYVGPFWRFELVTGPVHRHRHAGYLDCAFGFGNYRPMHPPRRAYVEIERKSPREIERRTRERNYTTVRYDELRTRTNIGATRSIESGRTSQNDPRSRDRAVENAGSNDRIRTDAERTGDRTRSDAVRTAGERTDAGRAASGADDAARDRTTDIRSDRTRESATDRSGTAATADRDRATAVHPNVDAARSSGASATPAGRIDNSTRAGDAAVDRARTPSIPSTPRETPRTPSIPSTPRETPRTPSIPSTTRETPRTPSADIARPAQQSDAARDRQTTDVSRDRAPRVEASRDADRAVSPPARKENSNASTRDRSPRAPEERSR